MGALLFRFLFTLRKALKARIADDLFGVRNAVLANKL